MYNKQINVGDKFPKFSLPSSDGGQISNKNFASKFNVLFVYPKNDTNSCTKEAIEFSNNQILFKDLKVGVFGLSKDNIASHKKFIKKRELTIPLLSDEELVLIKLLNAWVTKSMYGKVYMGVERSTFLMSEEGLILKIWRKVKVNNHVREVIETIKSFD
jgi:peroxiredoxin Q/BCP